MPKYFSDDISLEMQAYIKDLVKKLEKSNTDFIFTKPPHEISCVWSYTDWCDWIDKEWIRYKRELWKEV
jgi:hypothetical protein